MSPLKIPAEIPIAQVVALIDTREQIALDLLPLKTEEATLVTGDYSLRGLERIVAVERKSLSDLLCCCGGERKRFEREIDRLLAYPVRLLVVESTWQQIEEGRWQSKIFPGAVRNSLLGWQARGLPVLMAGSHQRAGEYVREFLVLAARRRWKECRCLLGGGQKRVKAVEPPPEDVPF